MYDLRKHVQSWCLILSLVVMPGACGHPKEDRGCIYPSHAYRSPHPGAADMSRARQWASRHYALQARRQSLVIGPINGGPTRTIPMPKGATAIKPVGWTQF